MSTLLWDGDELIDVTIELRLRLDGTVSSRSRSAGYPFDRAVGFRQGDILWSVAYDNRGTKGILMKNGAVHRELNRSFYFAKEYDYPVAITVTPTGRVVVIHCPNAFDTLEIEDAETGTTLATKQSRDMEFHSRLSISDDGKYLLDAGWFWHPLGGAWICDLSALLENPSRSGSEFAFSFGAEIDSAAFLNNETIVVTSTEEVVNEIPATGIGPMKIGVWSTAIGEWTSMADLAEPSGTIMPWREWVIAFREHRRRLRRLRGTSFTAGTICILESRLGRLSWAIRRHRPWRSTRRTEDSP
jgi:hypothetical protein